VPNWSIKMPSRQDAKPTRKEGLADRHLNHLAFAEFAKDALGLCRIVHLDAHAEALRLGCKLRWRVAAHRPTIADLQSGVDDTSDRFRLLRNARIGRRIGVAASSEFCRRGFFRRA
jgi:hypothetical protein